MKRHSLNAFTLVILITGMIIACKKKETETTASTSTSTSTTTTGGTTGVASGSFVWQESGGSTINADSAFWTTGNWGTGVRAYKGGMANFFEINWLSANNTSVGTKTLDPAYGLTFIKSNITYTTGANQTLTISDFSNNQLSGHFNVPVSSSGGTITALSGTFTTIGKK